jgi:hypothetical protein
VVRTTPASSGVLPKPDSAPIVSLEATSNVAPPAMLTVEESPMAEPPVAISRPAETVVTPE